ncbi:serine/threonine protein kinase [Paenibacillus contaminans]|uniref:Protein kinase domain-containing protein n=1 Tax=Paenibacillus contaminans TaxID=450362 RepID=A0A329MI28_9BACL|nr:serine/threonine-protein kinase [Paenibacillus contaminans]RAV19464.1 hypothetical protein DQG23_20960 [Paenibacillus contaminans]
MSEYLLNQVEKLKENLINKATGNEVGITHDEFKNIRRNLMTIPHLKEKLPDFVITYRDMTEFWDFIKEKFNSYKERRNYIIAAFNPLLDSLELSDSSLIFDYDKIDRLGNGGFGEVFRYKHKLLDVDFAFKIFSPMFLSEDEGSLQRFFQEARILLDLNHPNIVKFYDLGILNNTPFIRMELIDGINLVQLLINKGIQSPIEALEIIEQVAKAISYAHHKGKVVHRDLKPSNIMINREGIVKVIDFGLGIFLEKDLQSRITKSNQKVAGGLYTAPELYENPKLRDERTDIYSIGAIWYELLIGKPPAGNGIGENLSCVSSIYKDVILTCLNDIESRYVNLEQLFGDITKIRSEIGEEESIRT